MGDNDLLGRGYLCLEGLCCQHEEFGLEDTLEGCWTINAKCFRMVSHTIGSRLDSNKEGLRPACKILQQSK